MNIILFNPALRDNKGNPSINLGDLIIGSKVVEILKEMFPRANLRTFSTHHPPTLAEMEYIQQADLLLVGGTNLLSSSVQQYNQWKLGDTPDIYVTPPIENAILFGTGWWQYQDTPDTVTKYFYRQILSNTISHSVRDSYTATKLSEMGIDNVLNTSCPTLWGLGGYTNIRTSTFKKCLTCFTDYRPDQDANNTLLEILLTHYPEGITIFPQGDHDIRDIKKLDIFNSNQDKIELLPHDISLFFKRVAQHDADYIGTRLHAGAYCMGQGLDSLILGVDNRSTEISKDINLPVIQRNDFTALQKWLEGKRLFDPIQLPLQAILEWKEGVRNHVKEVQFHKPSSTKDKFCSQHAKGHQSLEFLNLGCGGNFHSEWVNVDFTKTGPEVIAHNLLKPLPFAEDCFDAVYHSHVLEHMPKRYAPEFLSECWRVLKPGGVLRVVVPDLELATSEYLQQLQAAKSGEQDEIDKLEYLTINLLDQISRHQSGGEMLNYWKQNPMPNEDFALQTHGAEVVRSLAVLRDPAASEIYKNMKTSFDFTSEHSAEQIGEFRTSGEPHLWMYDEVSLKQVMLGAGFSKVCVCKANVSNIPDFSSFGLEVLSDGSIAKPDSIILEGVKVI